MKKTLSFLFCLLYLLACSPEDSPAPPTSTDSPNILLIIADDMGVDACPGYPEGQVKPNMPTLTRLASEGLTFDNAWAYPLCAPTRAAMLTGRYGYRTGVRSVGDPSNSTLPNSEKTLHAYLDEQRGGTYAHALIGKWHLSANEPLRPTQMGIGYYAGILGGSVNNYDRWQLTENGQTQVSTEYVTAKLTDLAINWMGQQDKPWFCWLAYNTPHTPFHLPPSGTHSQGNLPQDEASIDANPQPYYMAMIENLDHEIGRLLDSLSTSQRENTVILFIGDNGTARQVIQSPFSGDQSKGSLTQGGIRVPLIVSGKGVSRMGQREEQLISCVDIFSTIAEIAGVSHSTYEDSKSFAQVFTSSQPTIRNFAYSETFNADRPNRSGYTIGDQQYKLIQFDSNRSRLYDLAADPYEQNDLLSGNLSDAEQAALVQLQAEAQAIRQ